MWVDGITYLKTGEGWVYLATVINDHSRRVISWAIAEHMRTDLMLDALQMALTLAGFAGQSDLPLRSWYAIRLSPDHLVRRANGITRLMGMTEICWDKAMAESFFAALKAEFYYRRI